MGQAAPLKRTGAGVDPDGPAMGFPERRGAPVSLEPDEALRLALDAIAAEPVPDRLAGVVRAARCLWH